MRRRSGLVRWAMAILVVLVAFGLVGAFLGQLPYPEVSVQYGRISVAVLTVLLGLSMLTAERRIRDDLALREHRVGGTGGATAVARSVHGQGLVGYGLAGLARTVIRLLATASPWLGAGLTFVLSCYLPAAGLGWAAWPVAALAGVLAGWVVARRITAWQRAGLTVRALIRARAGLALAVAVVLALVIARPLHGPALAGVIALLAVSLAGAYAGRGVAVQAHRRRRVVGQLSASLSVAQSTLEDPAKARWTVDRSGSVSIAAPLPADVIRGLVGLESRLAEHLPTHEVHAADPERGLHLVAATPETRTRRELVASTAGLVVAVEGDEDQVWTLSVSVRPADGPALAELARQQGLALVAFDPHRRMAAAQTADERMVAVRSRIAELVGASAPWDLAVDAEWEDSSLVGLVVTRGAVIAPERAKRRERWREAFEQLSPYRPGTHVTYSEDGPSVTIRRVLDPLWKTTSIADFTAAHVDPQRDPAQSWQSFPVAIGEDGKPVTLPLFHMVGIGQTGSGKGSYLWAVLSGLLPAWRAGLVDVYGVDPKSAEAMWEQDGRKVPHGLFTEVATTPDDWAELIDGVHSEMKRRQAVSGRSFRASPENPALVVVVDELSALKLLDPDKNRSGAVEQQMLEIASQGRSDGVFLIAAVQQPQKELLGRLRPFFGYRIALRTENPLETDLVLGTGATEAGAAAHRIPVASPGNGYASAGIGYLAADGESGYQRIRFPYTSDAQLGVWHEECLAVRPRSGRRRLGAPMMGWKPETPAEVEELEEMDLGELELNEPEPEMSLDELLGLEKK